LNDIVSPGAEAGDRSSDTKKKDYPKLATLSVLHMAQYFPITFTGVALPFLFRQEGLPLEMFWLLALPSFPRWLKFLIALVVDNYGNERIGRRKSWIIPTTIGAVLLYATLSFFPPTLESIYIIVGILVFGGFIMAAQDIAVDAYAAEAMQDHERAVGTSLINVLGSVSSVIGTAAVALVAYFGWEITMFVASILMLIAALPAMVRKEPTPPPATLERLARGQKADLVKAIKRKDSHYILPFMFMFGMGQVFFLSMVGPFWADQGMSIGQYGILAPASAITGGVLAATLTPWLIERTSMRFTAIIGLSILPVEAAVYCYFYYVPGIPAMPVLIVTVALLSFSTNLYMYTVTISRFRWVSKAQAGTDYSMQSSMWNLGVWAAGSTAGLVAGQFGYMVFFPVAALVTMVGGVFYVVKWRDIETMVLDREDGEVREQKMLNGEIGNGD